MTDISDSLNQLWSMFTDLFYLVLSKYDSIVLFHTVDNRPVSLLDFCLAILVIGIVLSVILGIRYVVPSQSDLH